MLKISFFEDFFNEYILHVSTFSAKSAKGGVVFISKVMIFESEILLTIRQISIF